MVISNTMAASQLSEGTCDKPPSISFGIEHILGDSVGRKRPLPESIVRPWDVHENNHDMQMHNNLLHHHHHHHHHHQNHHNVHMDANNPRRRMESPVSSRDCKLRISDFSLKTRHRSDDDVDQIKKHTLVSPLDALFKLTNTTFDKTTKSEQNSPDIGSSEALSVFTRGSPSKKRRKSRTAFTNQQIFELEKRFIYQKYLTPTDRDDIALTLGLSNSQVITWFQNRRAKLKRDLEELKADVTAASIMSSET